MYSIRINLCSFLLLITAGLFAQNPVKNEIPASTRMIWYDQPADLWIEALPIGNGRLGGMVYGGTHEEIIKLNENSLYAGGPYNSNGPGGYAYLDSIRNLVFEGKGKEAEELFEKTMMARNWKQESAPYQPLGNIRIFSPGHAFVSDYNRELLLDSALALVSYKVGDIKFTRTAFCSYPDQVMVIKIDASKPGSINTYFQLEGVTNPGGTRDEKWGISFKDDNTLILSGITRSIEVSDERLRYESRIRAVPEGGSMEIIYKANMPLIHVEGANSVTLYMTTATSYVNYNDISGDPVKRNNQVLNDLGSRTYDDILKDHVLDFSELFNRVSLDLANNNTSDIPTDQRFDLFACGEDPNFASLFFQYGRYLLISCSRPGGIPANLQGLWNQDMNPAWNGGFTTNINFEMNYWLSDMTNLSECREPQLTMIRKMSETGRETARLNFNADGWIFNCNTDIWLMSAPIYGAYWGSWHTAAAWFCDDLWEHFLFTQDTAYLKEYYPLIRDAALFFDQTLVEHPKYGWLVINPSGSPENGPGGDPAWTRNPDGTRNRPIGICASSTCDNALVSELFEHFIEASLILGQDEKLRKSLAKKKKRLPPYQIGQYGQLQEWLEDLDIPEDKHRHTSHLWGLHPGTSIDPLKTPKLADAAKITLKHRGDESTGWAIAWRTNYWARLRDGNKAYKLLRRNLTLVDSPEYGRGPGGTYLNLFDAHPPFQIDGNFGGTSAITEMILQSHNEYIEFLPALPDAWPNGECSGLCARGAFEIDLKWDEGEWIEATILSKKGVPCVIISDSRIGVTAGGRKVKVSKAQNDKYSFLTEPGGIYTIINRDVLKMALLEEHLKGKKDFSRFSSIYDLIRNEIYNVNVNGTQITTKHVTTINAGTEVLLVVNGAVVNNISYINPNDVESIRYVHNNEATKYGVRGSNGAIEIVLK